MVTSSARACRHLHARRSDAREPHAAAARRVGGGDRHGSRRASLSLHRPRRAPEANTWLAALLQFGDESDRPIGCRTIVVDRCYLHGDPRKGTRRGIALNARRAAVVDSYLADFKEAGADSQAIAGWNGPGPFAITNNYLEAAGRT